MRVRPDSLYAIFIHFVQQRGFQGPIIACFELGDQRLL
jgi:hypothetical protein